MCAQEQIHRQTLQHLERFDIIIGDLRIVLITHQNGAGIHVRAADDHGIQLLSAFIDLHRPCGAAFRVAGRQVCGELRAAEFHRISIVQYAIDLRAWAAGPRALRFSNVSIHDH